MKTSIRSKKKKGGAQKNINITGLPGIYRFLKKTRANVKNRDVFNFINRYNLSTPMVLKNTQKQRILNNYKNSYNNNRNNNGNVPEGYDLCRIIESIGNQYRIIKYLGKGQYGLVYLAEPLSEEAIGRCGGKIGIALKEINAPSTQDIKKILIETIALYRCKNPFITNILDFMVNSSNRHYIAMDLAPGGDMYENIRLFRDKGLSINFKFNLVQTITKQLLIALYTLHQKDIIHSDLKPENIVLMNNGDDFYEIPYVKLADFGLAYIYPHRAYQGSPLYMAPEVANNSLNRPSFEDIPINQQLEILKKTDVWSLACIILELLTGFHIFEKGNYGVRTIEELQEIHGIFIYDFSKNLHKMEISIAENYIINYIKDSFNSFNSEHDKQLLNIVNFFKKCFTKNNDRALIIELIQYLNDNPWGDVVESKVPELDKLWSELVGSGKENYKPEQFLGNSNKKNTNTLLVDVLRKNSVNINEIIDKL